MSKLTKHIGGSQALLGAAFLFALTNVLVREMSTMWGDQAQVAVRFAIVWIILVIFAQASNKKVSIPKAKKLSAVLYALCAGTAILFFTLSVQSTTIANTLFTSNATELFVAFLLGTALLHEKLTAKKFIAIGFAIAGLAFYAESIVTGSIGIIFGLLAGATTAICNLLAKKLKGVDLWAIMRVQFGIGTLFMIALTVIFSPDDILRTVSIAGIVATIAFSLILIAATRLVLYGFQNSDINIASVILSSQLAFGALLGYFIYQEVLSPNELISGIFILCAAIVGGLSQKNTERNINTRT